MHTNKSTLCYFVFLSVLWVLSSVNKPESSRVLTIFVISSTSSSDILNTAIPERKTSLCIPASAADSVAVYPDGVKAILDNVWSTFFINGNPNFIDGLRSLAKIHLILLFSLVVEFLIILY